MQRLNFFSHRLEEAVSNFEKRKTRKREREREKEEETRKEN